VFGYIAAFSNAGGLKFSDVENDVNFALVDPCENKGESWRISIPIVEALSINQSINQKL